MTAAVTPTPTAFCTSTNGSQTPVMPNSTHCAAIQALFVHTVPANDGRGVLAVVADEALLGVVLAARASAAERSRAGAGRRATQQATSAATATNATAITSVVHRTRYSAAGSCSAKNRGIWRSDVLGRAREPQARAREHRRDVVALRRASPRTS